MGIIIGSDMETTRGAAGAIEIDNGAEICLGERIAATDPGRTAVTGTDCLVVLESNKELIMSINWSRTLRERPSMAPIVFLRLFVPQHLPERGPLALKLFLYTPVDYAKVLLTNTRI